MQIEVPNHIIINNITLAHVGFRDGLKNKEPYLEINPVYFFEAIQVANRNGLTFYRKGYNGNTEEIVLTIKEFSKESSFEKMIKIKSINVQPNKEKTIFRNICVRDITSFQQLNEWYCKEIEEGKFIEEDGEYFFKFKFNKGLIKED
jgi:hypothetical protein